MLCSHNSLQSSSSSVNHCRSLSFWGCRGHLYVQISLNLLFVCVSANNTTEEGDPVSEGRVGHGDRRAKR